MMVVVGGRVAFSARGVANLEEVEQEKQANHDLE